MERVSEESAGQAATTRVVTVAPDASVCEVADRMAEAAVGTVVVVSDEGRAIGIITDRDLVLRVLAEGRPVGPTPASAVMSHPLVTAAPDVPLDRLAALMRERAVRRIPLVEQDRLVGLVAMDDVLGEVADALGDLVEAARKERSRSERSERSRRRADDLERLVSRGLDAAVGLAESAREAWTRARSGSEQRSDRERTRDSEKSRGRERGD
jgi:CBS domain-containing protein